MAVDDTGDWGQPGFLASGAPEVDVDPTAVSDYYAPMVPRQFTTLASLLAATPPAANYSAKADNCPGAIWIYNGSAWKMYGIAVFATAGARSSVITAPHEDMLTIREDADYIEIYRSSAWVECTKFPDKHTVFTRAAANLSTGATMQALDFTGTPIVGAAFTESAGVFTCVTAGTYKVTLSVTFAANATSLRGAGLSSSVMAPTTRVNLFTSLSGSLLCTLTVEAIVVFAANDTITAQALQNSGGNLSTSGELAFEKIA